MGTTRSIGGEDWPLLGPVDDAGKCGIVIVFLSVMLKRAAEVGKTQSCKIWGVVVRVSEAKDGRRHAIVVRNKPRRWSMK